MKPKIWHGRRHNLLTELAGLDCNARSSLFIKKQWRVDSSFPPFQRLKSQKPSKVSSFTCLSAIPINMRNPSETALIAFTANLLGIHAFQHPTAFQNRRVSKRKQLSSRGGLVRVTTPTQRYFLDSSYGDIVEAVDNTSFQSERGDDVLVYKSDDAAFSLLKPYLEFNELDLQQLFGKDDDDASLYDDIEEMEIRHYPKNGIEASSRTVSPFYFCQHKQPVTLPPWLSLLNPSTATSKLSALRRDLSPHLSPKQISTVMEALRTAAKSDLQLAGAAEFCSLLVNSLEMSDVAALIGSAFHYCSLVGVREREMQMKQSPNQEDGSTHLDTKYLCALAGSGIESYSPHAMKIALDAARLKSMEATAAKVVKTSPQTSANLRSLLLSVNEVGDWRALAVRSAACLYRLQGLRKWRESGLAGDENGRSEEERRVGHEALHIYAPLGKLQGVVIVNI